MLADVKRRLLSGVFVLIPEHNTTVFFHTFQFAQTKHCVVNVSCINHHTVRNAPHMSFVCDKDNHEIGRLHSVDYLMRKR